VTAGSAPALPPGWRLECHESLPSTACAIRARAEAGEAAGLAILARRQSAGRGRAGRGWSSPEGNLYLSLLLRPTAPARCSGQWGLLAGVALAEAAAARDPDAGALRLKWPNDLLRHGAKVAGILTEGALAADPPPRMAWIAFGIGVNLAVAPRLPDRATATLALAEPPEAFAARLIARLDHWVAVQARDGFGPVRAAWEARGPSLGGAVAVRDGPATLTGRFAGLAPDGGLLLDTDQGRRHILAGEVLDPAPGAPPESGADAQRTG
jgi:BirA family biotin operon repressor/biotin-[acetyl-CoA-carboxylase] ligase